MVERSLRRCAIASAFLIASCAFVPCRGAAAGPKSPAPKTKAESSMDRIAESFVKLALAVGEHDPLYVDAYFGPEAWREQAKKEKRPLEDIRNAAAPLIAELERLGREPGRGAAPAPARVSDQAARIARGAREHARRREAHLR